MSLKDWVDFFKNLRLPDSFIDQGYYQVDQEDIEIVMWENAARIFFGEKV